MHRRACSICCFFFPSIWSCCYVQCLRFVHDIQVLYNKKTTCFSSSGQWSHTIVSLSLLSGLPTVQMWQLYFHSYWLKDSTSITRTNLSSARAPYLIQQPLATCEGNHYLSSHLLASPIACISSIVVTLQKTAKILDFHNKSMSLSQIVPGITAAFLTCRVMRLTKIVKI